MLNRMIILALTLLIPCFSGQLEAGSAQKFEKNDTVLFLGDSIIHGGKFHTYVNIFYMTRYPQSPFRLHNGGIAGDTAEGALRRFDWDVMENKPNKVVVMLGMNDVGRYLFPTEKVSNFQFDVGQKEKISLYQENMDQLIGRLKAKKIAITLCTPSAYDQTVVKANLNYGVNDALGECAKYVRTKAKQEGLGLVDLHAPMTELTLKKQLDDPLFTLTKDRIHPSDGGHFVMATLFLRDQGLSGPVSRVVIDAKNGTLEKSERCKVASLDASADEVMFDMTAESLPFPARTLAPEARMLAGFDEEFNREILQVKGLKKGEYLLSINGMDMGIYASEELKSGIDLATNTNTPQYQQALKIAQDELKRAWKEQDRIRLFAAIEHDILRPRNVDPKNMEQVEEAFNVAIEDAQKANSWQYSYFKALRDPYLLERPRKAEIMSELRTGIKDGFYYAKPSSQSYSLTRVR